MGHAEHRHPEVTAAAGSANGPDPSDRHGTEEVAFPEPCREGKLVYIFHDNPDGPPLQGMSIVS